MAVVCLVVGIGTMAKAALLAYDPFLTGLNPAAGEYKQGLIGGGGTELAGQNPQVQGTEPGFYTSAWANIGGQPQNVTANSLNYYHYPEEGGRVNEWLQYDCCTFGRSARDIRGGTAGGLGVGRDDTLIYESFLVNFGTQGGDADPADFGDRAYESWNGAPDDANLAVWLGLNSYGSINELSLSVTSVGTATQTVGLNGGGLDLPALATSGTNGVHLVVLKYDLQADVANPDTVTAYLDPTDSIEGNWTPAATISVPTGDLAITSHGAFTEFTFSGNAHIPGAVDEFRWGDTFADVTPFVPEPSSLVLVVLGALGVMMARRK